jgi:hypothetical protein
LASPNWTRPPRRRDKNRSCSDQPQNPPPCFLGVTGHNVKHALEMREAILSRAYPPFSSGEMFSRHRHAHQLIEIIDKGHSLRRGPVPQFGLKTGDSLFSAVPTHRIEVARPCIDRNRNFAQSPMRGRQAGSFPLSTSDRLECAKP